MKFLVDECLSPRVAKALSEAEWDAIHVSERGLNGEPDEVVLSCALREGRTLISVDTDFGEMLIKSGASSPSVLLLRRSEYRADRQVELILAYLPSALEDLEYGAIVVLTQDHIRIRSIGSRIPESQPEQLKALYAKIAKTYAERYFDNGSDFDIVEQLLKRLTPEARVLDVGCGPGTFTKYASERGFLAEGIDLSPVMVAEASQRLPHCEFHEMDVRTLSYPDNSFDGVIAGYSLIHIPSRDMQAALGELRRVLKPEGLLLVIGQSGKADHVEDDPLAPGEVVFVNFFTVERLRDQFEAAGFIIDELDVKASGDETSMSTQVVWALVHPRI